MKINYILFVVLFSLYSNLAYSNNPCANFFDKVKKATGVAVTEAKKSLSAMQGDLTQAKETLSETSQRGWGNVAKEKVDNVTGGVKNSASAMLRDAQQGTSAVVEKAQTAITARSTSKENKKPESVDPVENTAVEKKDEKVVVSKEDKELNWEDFKEGVTGTVKELGSMVATLGNKFRKEYRGDELIFFRPINDLEMKTHTTRILKDQGIDSIGDLVLWREEDILGISGVGKKTFEEIRNALLARNLTLGMLGEGTRLENWPPEVVETIEAGHIQTLSDYETLNRGFINEVKKSATAMVGEVQQARETLSENSQRGWGNVAKEKVDNVTGGVKNSATAMVRDAQQATSAAVEKAQTAITARSTSKENKEENINPAEDTTVGKKDEEAVVSTEKESISSAVLLQEINSLNLKPLTVNVLKANGEIYIVETLIQYSEKELLSIPDFGPKKLEEVKKALAEKGLQLGTNLKDLLGHRKDGGGMRML